LACKVHVTVFIDNLQFIIICCVLILFSWVSSNRNWSCNLYMYC